MQREIRLTPILLVVLGVTTALMLALILLLWTTLPPNLQSGLPFAISTVVVVNTALLRAIPILGKRLAEGDSASTQRRALVDTPPNAQAYRPAGAPVMQPPQQRYVAPVAAPSATLAAPATTTCRRCGKIPQVGDAFCRQCGSALTGALAAPPLAAPAPQYAAQPIAQPIAQPAPHYTAQAAPQPVARPIVQPARAPVGSVPLAPPPMAVWSGAGPITSLGGTVAVSQPVHRFMSKRVLRYLLFIGTAFTVVSSVMYFIIGFIVGACSGGTSDVSACAPATVTWLNVFLVLALIIWLPGIVLVLLADVFALIRVALVRRWGWFIAILVTYLFFWNIAMFFYVFVGPEEPPASQYPAAKALPR